jgi:ribonuclease Z
VVTICGDTRKCKASEILAYRSDVLVHEATYEGDKGQQAYRHFHSTSLQAAEVAKNAEVKQLLLTHISARYLGKQSQELEDEAKTIFENVHVVKDFDIVTVERIKPHEGC